MKTTHAYIGVWDGTAKMAIGGNAGEANLARFAAEVFGDGGTLHRVTAEWVRAHFYEDGAAADL